MSPLVVYGPCAAVLFGLGLYAVIVHGDVIRRLLALNVMGSAVFLFLAAVAARGDPPLADPVPHAMVLTGIVVAVSATAFALALARRLGLTEAAGRSEDDAP